MTDDSPEPDSEDPGHHRRTFVDLAPLKASPAFARLWVGQSISGIGAWLTTTAVSLLIFDIAQPLYGDAQATLLVALVGPIALVPMIIAGIWGGMLVDAFDRRTVALVTAIVGWLSTASLVVVAFADLGFGTAEPGRVPIWPLYVITTVNAVATTINSAARSAAIPRILPERLVARAAALNGVTIGLQLAIGPALAGVLVASIGFAATFLIDVVLFSAGFLGILGLPRIPPESAVDRPGLSSMREGARFLARAPNIRMSFIVDLVAMVLGRPHALFPAIGAAVLGGGSVTVGALTASMAVGTFLGGLFSGPVARVRRHGAAISAWIMVYGAFTIVLGLDVLAAQLGWFGPAPADGEVLWPALVIAVLALAGTGVSDEFSAIFRTTMLLTAAPDEMRGRVQGVFMVVVTGGPRLGDLVAGGIAAAIGLWAPPLIGGVAIIAVIGLLLGSSARWRAYDARHPTP